MKKSLAVLAAAAVVAVPLLSATSAQAYDKDAYAYAASHMLLSKDLPASLGDFGTNMGFSAGQNNYKMSLCFIGQKEIKAPGGDLNFGADFYESGTRGIGTNLMENVRQYASAQKAIKAFDTISTNIKGCKGASSQSWDNGDGTTVTGSSLTTNGKVPMVTEVGVESVFVNVNYLNTSSTGKDIYANDSYTVYTLLNDVIIATSFTSGSTQNIPNKQRKQVNKVAFAAIGRWLE